eukprot:15347013-Ditylum_brightwellii.AAC.1
MYVRKANIKPKYHFCSFVRGVEYPDVSQKVINCTPSSSSSKDKRTQGLSIYLVTGQEGKRFPNQMTMQKRTTANKMMMFLALLLQAIVVIDGFATIVPTTSFQRQHHRLDTPTTASTLSNSKNIRCISATAAFATKEEQLVLHSP